MADVRQQMRRTSDTGQRTISRMIVYDIIYVTACEGTRFAPVARRMSPNLSDISPSLARAERLLFLGTGTGVEIYLSLPLREGWKRDKIGCNFHLG